MPTYRLGSTEVVNTPSVVAWAIREYSTEVDKQRILRSLSASFPLVPLRALEQLLSKAVAYDVERGSLIFSTVGTRNDPLD